MGIRRHLSIDSRMRLNDFLKDFLKNPIYSLSHQKLHHQKLHHQKKRSIESIRELFAANLAKLDDEKNSVFWSFLEKALNEKKGRYRWSLLTSFDLSTRVRIAKQLFPRLTWRQQTALLERQQKRATYLKNYKELQSSVSPLSEQIEATAQFIKAQSSPLSTLQRNKWQSELNENKSSFLINRNAFEAFKQRLFSLFQPTYFNLMKAMYPLLADIHELNVAVNKFSSDSNVSFDLAGERIGRLDYSIEFAIEQVEKFYQKESDIYKLSRQIAEKIAQKENPHIAN